MDHQAIFIIVLMSFCCCVANSLRGASQRKRRTTTESVECSINNDTMCFCERTMVETYLTDDFSWIIAPVRVRSYLCGYRCYNIFTGNFHEQSVRDHLESGDMPREICRPVVDLQPLSVLYVDANHRVMYRQVMNIVVTDCLCAT